MTAHAPPRCLACGRALRPTQATSLGWWATAASLALAATAGDSCGLELRPAVVCRGACGRPDVRQRMAEESCVREGLG